MLSDRDRSSVLRWVVSISLIRAGTAVEVGAGVGDSPLVSSVGEGLLELVRTDRGSKLGSVLSPRSTVSSNLYK